MISTYLFKAVRLFLLPFALIYWGAIKLRNWLYDLNILKMAEFGLPLICVGNLTTGGTGKSPMVEYLVSNLKSQFNVATLSRGYKRRTKGYVLANESTTALEIGDEPMQFHLKFPDIPVAVGEARIEAIPQLLHDRPATEVIILDDAFQHRTIRTRMNILLTDYSNLFTRDFYLPAGNLRDLKSSYRRAEVIIVTKCPSHLTADEKYKIIREINPLVQHTIFFTSLAYGTPYHFFSNESLTFDPATEILVISGIANPKPLLKMISEKYEKHILIQYKDHHIFTIVDLKKIKKKFEQMKSVKKIILTTEKDAVRLFKFNEDIRELPLFVIPVRHQFLFHEENRFKKMITEFIQNFKQPAS